MYLKLNSELSRWQKYAVIFSITLLTIFLLLFLAIWVIFPIVFMNNISVQASSIFLNIDNPSRPDFDNPAKYDLDGTVNFFITTNNTDGNSVAIGTWLILPENQQNMSVGLHSAGELLANTSYPVLLYMHGVYANRAKPIYAYKALRKQFIIIAIDYRGFGDSSNLQPSELGIVNDTIQIYEWIRNNTQNEIYIWGHSLGSALATHVVRKLREEHDIIPMGLFLESPLTTLREAMPKHPIGKLFSWLAYFDETFLNPLEKNGFHFRTSTNILYVDCPIMILHAKDDDVVPWEFGSKLTKLALERRCIEAQGDVIYYQFDEKFGYNHMHITTDPHLNVYIRTFLDECRRMNRMVR
ncbi:unnamed protein product [Phaedon cochleariae]|uniref:AB hydrolase-1 domain-containing protein n=1 Tax=Phaedon cochleariae TaxID=80249 RepID=A0A9P0DB92_PHACE|nr:unnamed protein product [Phaedon cochleariae]